ncbi:hypothetical protein M9H77_29832 [Catharanthus roseus]|uniref:Uncharacterized protein n=1 Tax=Catharanthus roseus TaxID=4058 RepID=A0ACB9ZVK1_CATRO|nr:hypothetical protein M9H77_29832 [Catharanthus roseus]
MDDQSIQQKRGCFRLHGKDVQVTAKDVHRILGLSIGGTDFEERFSPIGEEVSLYRNRRTPRIVDWSHAVINQRVQKLRELRLFSGVDVDMVDALGPRKDAAELEALRSRLDSFVVDVIEVKCELKSLRENDGSIAPFMTFIKEKYREGGDIQMNCEQTKKTRSEILRTETWRDLPESRPKNMQPLVDDRLNGPIVAKLVTEMSVPCQLARDLDCLVVAEDVATNDKDEDTVSDRQIDEGNDMVGCNQICAERVVNNEEVAQCVQFDRPPRRSARNRPPLARIIKGGRSARMPRREAAKDFGKSVVNDTGSKEAWKFPSRVLFKEKRVLKMIDLRRFPDVKFEILQNLWDLKKDPGKSVVKMRLGLHKALQHGFKDKYKLEVRGFLIDTQIGAPNKEICKFFYNRFVSIHDCVVFVMKFLENASDLKLIKQVKVDSIYQHSYVFKLFMSDDNIARGIVLRDLDC